MCVCLLCASEWDVTWSWCTLEEPLRTKQSCKKEKWNTKSTWSRKRGERKNQRGPGQWEAGLRSSQQPWSLPSLSLLFPPLSQTFPPQLYAGYPSSIPWLSSGISLTVLLAVPRKCPPFLLTLYTFPAWETLHKNAYEAAEPKASLGRDYLYT